VWRAAWVPIVTTLVMAAAVILTERALLSILHVGDLPTLIACLFVAAVVYLGMVVLLDRRILLEGRAVLLKGL
jgi:hypothetical protein